MSSSAMNVRTKKRWAIAGALVVAAGGGALAFGQATPQPPAAPPQALPADVAANKTQPPTPAPGTTDPAPVVVAPPKPPQDPLRARITFSTIPMTNAKIVWGKQTLGSVTPKAALTVVRPRDTGPMDVMVYAPGYLPVQVRAHTFEDAQVIVRLTTPENKHTLWGYRAPLDAGVMPADQLPTAPEEISGQQPL